MGHKVVTGLEIQQRNHERVNIFLDGAYAFSLNLIDAAKLHKGQSLSEADIALLCDEDAVTKAVDSAARFLGYRPRSIEEVRQNLKKKNIPPAVSEVAIERLCQMGYLDDVAFARYWVDNRNSFNPRGPQALRYELKQKGVADSVINTALGDGLDVEEAAYRAASGRVSRFQGVTRQEFRSKMSSFLQRRGFAYDTIHDVVEKLIREQEAEDYFQSEAE